ncbi:MutS-related protein [Sphingobacterium cellulitidis]|uniref:MutS-related protein n=1 Tax=Sphingobacterium cellulitidis TaxID=1768011 RepID=UPI003C7C5AA3
MSEKFLIDEQTLKDLQLRDRHSRTLLQFFDNTITDGGMFYLMDIFYDAVLDIDIIKDRQMKIRRLEPVADEEFLFYRVIIQDLEKYVKSSHSGRAASLTLMDFIGVKAPAYYYKKRSILEACEFMIKCQNFYKKVNQHAFYQDVDDMIQLIEECLSMVFKKKNYDVEKLKINIFNIENFDKMIRYTLAPQLKKIISFFYEIDAFLSVAKVSKAHGFCYPEVYPKNQTGVIEMDGVYHTFHKNPVKNDIRMERGKKIWFLTGANMAGKSSIIKTISTALYLTHIGFPVPADAMRTDLIDGVFTSINLQDNLDLGYSHFYVEAIRLKTIVDQLPKNSNAVIILDELFKGTNHIDAYNAILKVLNNLADVDGPYVIVSSHITELAKELVEIPSVGFYKMLIENDSEGLPIFTYKIKEGIAEEKLGMWLLKKSGAFDSIDRLKS